MDKYEYRIRAEEINSLIDEQEYVQAVKIADTIDWRRVRSVVMLCKVSELYKMNRRYEDSKEVLLLAYDLQPGSRKIVYSLCELSIKLEETVQAVEYYKEFVQIAPKDTGRFILQYRLYEAQDVSLEERIAVLEEYKKRDYREKWAYELAYLYHRIGLATRCVEECDELILWFGEGKYVVKAMELKMLHAPLTLQQQEKYNARFMSELEAIAAVEAGEPQEEKEVEPSMSIEIKTVEAAKAKTAKMPSKKIAQETGGTKRLFNLSVFTEKDVEKSLEDEEPQEELEDEEVLEEDIEEEILDDEMEEDALDEEEDVEDTEESDEAEDEVEEEIEEEVALDEEDEDADMKIVPEKEEKKDDDLDIQVKTIDVDDEYSTINLQEVLAKDLAKLFAQEDMEADDATRALPIDTIFEAAKIADQGEEASEASETEEKVEEAAEEVAEETEAEKAEESKETEVAEEKEEVSEEPTEEKVEEAAEEEAEETEAEKAEEPKEAEAEEDKEEKEEAKEVEVAEEIAPEADDKAVELETESFEELVEIVKEAEEEEFSEESEDEAVAKDTEKAEEETTETAEEVAEEAVKLESDVFEELVEVVEEAAKEEEEISKESEDEAVAKEPEEAEEESEEVAEEAEAEEEVKEEPKAPEKEITPLIFNQNEPLPEAFIQAMQTVAMEAAKQAAQQVAQQVAQQTVSAADKAEEVKEEKEEKVENIPEEDPMVQEQITGQLSFSDIMGEWEKTKKENEEKHIDEMKKRMLEQTGPLFSDFEGFKNEPENQIDVLTPSLDIFSETEDLAKEVEDALIEDELEEKEEEQKGLSRITSLFKGVFSGSEEKMAPSIADTLADINLSKKKKEEQAVELAAKEVAKEEEVTEEDTIAAEETTEEIAEEITEQTPAETEVQVQETEEKPVEEPKTEEVSEVIKESVEEIKTEVSEELPVVEKATVEESAVEEPAVEEPKAEEIKEEVKEEPEEEEEIKPFQLGDDVPSIQEVIEEAPVIEAPVAEESKAEVVSEETFAEEQNKEETAKEEAVDENAAMEAAKMAAVQAALKMKRDAEEKEKMLESTFNTAEINGLEEKLMTELSNQHYDTTNIQVEALSQEMSQMDDSTSQSEAPLQVTPTPVISTPPVNPSEPRALTKTEKDLFGSLAQTKDLATQIASALDSINFIPFSGNVIVTGEVGTHPIDIAKNLDTYLKETNDKYSKASEVREASDLSEKEIPELLEKLKNGLLIIDHAGDLSQNTIVSLANKLNDTVEYGIVVVLVDTKRNIERLTRSYARLHDIFNVDIDITALDNDGLVKFGKEYANSMEYSIDDMGTLALYNRIEERQSIDHAVTVDEVRLMVTDAISNAERKNVGHFMDVIFAKRYDNNDMIVLREKDFIN